MKQTFSLVSNSTHDVNILKLFLTSAASRPDIFSNINGMIVMISGIAFDRPDSVSSISRSLQNLHDPPNRPHRTQLYSSEVDRLSHPGHLRSSG